MTLAALHHTQGDYATGISAAEQSAYVLGDCRYNPRGNDKWHGGVNDIASIKSEKLCTKLKHDKCYL